MTENKRFWLVSLKYGGEQRFVRDNNQIGEKSMSNQEVVDTLNKFQELSINDLKQIEQLKKENEQLKKELKVYHKVARCSNCKYHNYDWDIDDGYGGEEYEVCDKGNDITDGICEDWEEL